MGQTLVSLLNEAGSLLEMRDYANAADRYREAMKLQPGSAAAAMGIAMIHNRTGQPEAALQVLQNLWKAIASSKAKRLALSKAAVLAQIGLAQQQLGRFREALQNFRQANALHPSADLDERIQQLENAVNNPNTIEQLLIRASQFQRAGQLHEATQAYHAALQINADHPAALHGLGLTRRAQKDFDGALPLIQQAIMLAPNRPDYYNDLGIVFQDRGELDKAISFHKRALNVDSTFVAAYINLGVAYKRQGKLDEAIEAYRQAITLQPNSPAAHNNLGNLLRVQGNISGARKELEEAIKLRPGYKDAIENLSELEREENKQATVSLVTGKKKIKKRARKAT